MSNSPFEPTEPGSYVPNPNPNTPPPSPYEPSGSQMPSPRKDRKKTSRLFVFLAIIAIVVVVIGGLSWFLIRAGSKTTPSTPVTTVVAKGQVRFLDSQNKAPGATDALYITATGLPNPPDGSEYDAWLAKQTPMYQAPVAETPKTDSSKTEIKKPQAMLN